MSAGPPLWQPSPGRIASAKLTAFMRHVAQYGGPDCTTYPQLYDWSVSRPADFWSAVWAFCGVIAERGSDRVLEHPGRMPGACWFPDARLNYAENLLKQADKGDAIVFRGENRVASRLSHDELRHEVSRFAQALHAAAIETHVASPFTIVRVRPSPMKSCEPSSKIR